MMIEAQIESDFLHYLVSNHYKPGTRFPSLTELSDETGVSVGKLREQMEVARVLGLIDASPRRGIVLNEYDFLPAVRLSLLTALALDRRHFDAFSSLRSHLEIVYWDEAVALLTEEDKEHLRSLICAAKQKLNQARIQIPYREHRDLHLAIFSRLRNTFVQGLLAAYWDAYEAVELNTYADYAYLQRMWDYHERIVDAIGRGAFGEGKQLLYEHMQLLNERGVSLEMPVRVESLFAMS